MGHSRARSESLGDRVIDETETLGHEERRTAGRQDDDDSSFPPIISLLMLIGMIALIVLVGYIFSHDIGIA